MIIIILLLLIQYKIKLGMLLINVILINDISQIGLTDNNDDDDNYNDNNDDEDNKDYR